MSLETPVITTFGRNVSLRPKVMVAPRSEEEVLQILKQYAGQRIRTMGRLHAWSEAARSDAE